MGFVVLSTISWLFLYFKWLFWFYCVAVSSFSIIFCASSHKNNNIWLVTVSLLFKIIFCALPEVRHFYMEGLVMVVLFTTFVKRKTWYGGLIYHHIRSNQWLYRSQPCYWIYAGLSKNPWVVDFTTNGLLNCEAALYNPMVVKLTT